MPFFVEARGQITSFSARTDAHKPSARLGGGQHLRVRSAGLDGARQGGGGCDHQRPVCGRLVV